MVKAKQKKIEKILISDGIERAYGNISDIHDELQDLYDNLGDRARDGDRGSFLDENISQLSNNDQPDVPEAVTAWDVEYEPVKGESKSNRRDNACAILAAIRDKCQSVIDDPQGAYGEDEMSEIETFHQEVSDAITEFENAEFSR